MPFIIIIGIIAFLLMEHALIFWLVFVPLSILFMLLLISFLKKGRLGIGELASALIVLVAMIIILMIVCIPQETIFHTFKFERIQN